MGTNGGGVVRYRDGAFRSVTTADGLPSDLVRALHVDDAGMLWVGTEGRGLARLDPAAWSGSGQPSGGRRMATLSKRHGLYDESIHEILADDFGRLWMSSNRGLFWIARAEANAVLDGQATALRSTSYTERDGMCNQECNGGFQPSGARTSDGRLWFATQDGVAVVDPSAIVPDTVPPPIVIEQVVAGDSSSRATCASAIGSTATTTPGWTTTPAAVRSSPSCRSARTPFGCRRPSRGRRGRSHRPASR